MRVVNVSEEVSVILPVNYYWICGVVVQPVQETKEWRVNTGSDVVVESVAQAISS